MIPEENMLRIASGACFKTSGINSTPSPKERLTANTNVSLRPISWDEIITKSDFNKKQAKSLYTLLKFYKEIKNK